MTTRYFLLGLFAGIVTGGVFVLGLVLANAS